MKLRVFKIQLKIYVSYSKYYLKYYVFEKISLL